jgi:hypothetical protein
VNAVFRNRACCAPSRRRFHERDASPPAPLQVLGVELGAHFAQRAASLTELEGAAVEVDADQAHDSSLARLGLEIDDAPRPPIRFATSRWAGGSTYSAPAAQTKQRRLARPRV